MAHDLPGPSVGRLLLLPDPHRHQSAGPIISAGRTRSGFLRGGRLLFPSKSPLVSAGVSIFFVALAPVGNIFYGIGVMMAERLLYLPSMGLCLAAAAAIEWGTRMARSALAWLDLGSTCQALGKIKEAEAAYRRTLEIAPDRPGPHFNLATLIENVGSDREAIDLYREALRIDPEDLRVLKNLGRALVGDGKAAEAIPILEHAVALSPAAPAPKVNLPAAHLERGDAVLAERIVREVLASHPDDQAAQRVLRAIERRPPGADPSRR